jgi:hypothetical protein
MEEFSARPPEGAPLHIIASLVYEHLTGCDETVASDMNFKRACDKVMQSWNRKHSYKIDRDTGEIKEDPQPGDISPREHNALIRARMPKP